MSMNTSVYVGPYIECDGVSRELIEEYEAVLSNGQGENTDLNSSKRYLIPNRKLPDVDRPMSFDRRDDYEPVPLLECGFEIQVFTDEAKEFIRKCQEQGWPCRISWGVVIGCF